MLFSQVGAGCSWWRALHGVAFDSLPTHFQSFHSARSGDGYNNDSDEQRDIDLQSADSTYDDPPDVTAGTPNVFAAVTARLSHADGRFGTTAGGGTAFNGGACERILVEESDDDVGVVVEEVSNVTRLPQEPPPHRHRVTETQFQESEPFSLFRAPVHVHSAVPKAAPPSSSPHLQCAAGGGYRPPHDSVAVTSSSSSSTPS